MENITNHNSTYNITPVCLDSSEYSTMEMLSVSCKTNLDKTEAKRDSMDTGIYTPDSNSDSPDPRSDNNGMEVSKSISVSRPILFWTDEEISQLEEHIKTDLTLNALTTRFPNKQLASIIKKIRDLQPILDWTKNEMYLLAGIALTDPSSAIKCHKDQFPCRNVSNITKKFQHYRNMVRRLNGIDYQSKWTNPEMTCLISLLGHDLTKATLQRELPDKSIEEIRNITSEMKIHSNFSHVEYIVFEQAVAENSPIEIILDQFPFINKEACKKKLLKLSELPQYRDTATKRLEELENLIKNEIKQIKDTIDLTHLKHLLIHDLTGKELRCLFPGISLKYLKSIAKDIGFDESGEYTPAEVKFLKNSLHKNAKLKSIVDELPFRSQLSIETKINNLEPDRRRSVFTSQVDELLYMAKWYSSDNFGNLSRRRNTSSVSNSNKPDDKANGKETPTKSHLDNEKKSKEKKVQLLNKRAKIISSDRKTRNRQPKQQSLEGKNERQWTRKATKSNSIVKVLKEESAYFQTVAGNRRLLKEGQKRQHEAPSLIKSETKLKKSKNQNSGIANKIQEVKMIREVKHENLRERKASKLIDIDNFDVENTDVEMPTSGSSKIEIEGKRSPYDPEDISNDTLIPLYGRQLYVNEIYETQPCPPTLPFIEDTNVMVKCCREISFTDTIAADIISHHCKNYRDMPISFPPLTILDRNTDSMILNPMNKVRIRFLLYPQHSELFILAEPKSNELDPINEIKKLFQLHYSLFFSHSSKLKKIILSEYMKEIDSSIEENDFVRFMFVIDKWNRLMIELTPYDVNIGSYDINEEIRAYLLPNELKIPTDEDIRLDLFFSEIQQSSYENTMENDLIEPPSPSFDLIKNMKVHVKNDLPGRLTPPVSSEEDNKENEPPIKEDFRKNNKRFSIPNTPTKFNTRRVVVNAVKPENYTSTFFGHLKEKTSISRFCVQQILLRVYSRIVSIESRKLRSYKAFTAEVYGELLPSFTSEVLTKVNLQPHQKFYDLGSGVGNTTFQAALEFGVHLSGGCEIMEHASKLTELQTLLLSKHLSLFGLKELSLNFALLQSFVDNDTVRQAVIECDVLLVNNYLFDVNLNTAVGKMLYGLKPGTKIISLRNFIRPRYKASGDKTIFDYLKVERHEMSNYLSVSWTANKVPYYISTVQEKICDEYF